MPLDRGTIVTVTITSEQYWKSPSFQGRLGIRCAKAVAVIVIVRRHLLLQRYEQFVRALYAEPKDEVNVGSYFTKSNLSLFQKWWGSCKEEENEHKGQGERLRHHGMLEKSCCMSIMKYYKW